MVNNPIWEGVYSSFSQVPSSGEGLISPKWKSSLLESVVQKDYAPAILTQKNGPFISLAKLLYRFKQTLKIIDFGGGLGKTYLELIASGVSADHLKYSLIESHPIVELATTHWKSEGPNFYSDINQVNGKQDIVLARSSLHYIPDWKQMIGHFASFEPALIILEDLLISQKESFATAQQYYGSLIPSWFLNKAELKSLLLELGYDCLFESPLNELKYKDGTLIEIKGACIEANSVNLVFLKK